MLTLMSEYLEHLLDWACLQKLHLQKLVVCLMLFDFSMNLALIFPSLMIQFVYVNPAGRAGFVGQKWVTHKDVFRFRRYQPWELDKPIDWDVDNRTLLNETRHILDANCSRYEFTQSIDGDPGDYLKEVAGRPNTSGYNAKLRKLIRLSSAIVAIMFMTEPILLLSLWWKTLRARLVLGYFVLRIIPLIIATSVAIEGNEHLLCAIDIIYNRHPIRTYLIFIALAFWLYEIIKFIILMLYCMEQTLTRKRKDYGFRRRRAPAKKGEGSDDNKTEAKGKSFDVEKQHKKNKTAKRGSGSEETISVKALAREILELGGSTEGDSAVEAKETEKQKTFGSGTKGKGEGSKPTTGVDDGAQRKREEKRGSKEVEGWNTKSKDKEGGDGSRTKSTKPTKVTFIA